MTKRNLIPWLQGGTAGLAFFLVAASTGWTQEIRRALPAGEEVRRALPVEPPVSPGDLAKFLAGVPLPESSSLAPLQDSPAYQTHVRELARLSRRYDENYFSKMRAWSAAELDRLIPMSRPLFYFFGGPDAVNALALFPSAPVYILGGLEPVGTITPPTGLSPEMRDAGLAGLRKAMEVVLSYGHFITKDMKTELEGTAFQGVMPLIYTFIVMAGGEVLSSQYFVLRGGVESPLPPDGAGKADGVRITFRSGPDRAPQEIIYLSANLANDALGNKAKVLDWARARGPGNVYLKAASYLLHEPSFSRIRQFLLEQPAVLQDDSGIPLRYFREGGWHCWFFGTYTGTLEIFQKYDQPEMHSAYTTPGLALPLPFGTGYKWRTGESNLLLAVRGSAQPATPVEAGDSP